MAAGYEQQARTPEQRPGTGELGPHPLWQRRFAASRLILLLIVIVLAVMPLTEHLWTWDNPITSGHDLEFTVLALLLFCGLIALLAHRSLATSPLLLRLLSAAHAPPPDPASALPFPAFARWPSSRHAGHHATLPCAPQTPLPLRI